MGSKGDDVRKYGEARKVRFDILLDPDRSVGRKFGVREVPTVFVVDADGAITYSGTEEGHTIWQMLKDQKMDTVSTSK